MLTADCTPHCGIRSNAEGTVTREGHYRCPQDPAGTGISWLIREGEPQDQIRYDTAPRYPMCARNRVP